MGAPPGIVASAVASFVPTSIAGLKLWLDASSLGLADSTAISSWTDLSGGTNHAAQATGSKQPLLRTNILAGRPVVRFDGIDDSLATPSIDLTGTSAVTIVAVASAASGGTQIIGEFSTNYNNVSTGFILYRTNSNQIEIAHREAAGPNTSAFDPTATLTTTPKIVAGQTDKTVATNEVDARINGGVLAGTRPANANLVGAYGNLPLFIGARNNASLFLNGDIAELLLYNTKLSLADLNSVGGYLGDKYSITWTTAT